MFFSRLMTNFILSVFLVCSTILEKSNTSLLIDEIFENPYDVNFKPTDNVTIVNIIPNTFILLSMDQQQETIQFTQDFIFTWFDPLVHWNPENVSYDKDWIKIPVSKIWLPDAIFSNAIDINNLLLPEQQTVDAHYSGEMRTSLPSVVTSPCPLIIDNFPYDIQKCNISIGPWNFDRTMVQVYTKYDFIQPESRRFEGNSEWELISIQSFQSDNYDFTLNSDFSEITFTVTLKRKPVYYVLVIQAPTFILCTLAIFGIFTPNSSDENRPEKVSMCLNMFAAVSIMLNLVADMMPKASRLPLLGNYIIAEVFVVTAATLVSILIHLFHHHVHISAIQPFKFFRYFILFESCKQAKVRNSQNRRRQVQVYNNSDISPSNIFYTLNNSINKTSFLVRKFIEKIKRKSKNQLEWLMIFDRIDLFFLALFQISNIIITSIYWK